MKNATVIKDNKWVWPAADEKSWEGQNEHLDLRTHILPHLKSNSIMVQAGGNCGLLLSTFVEHFDSIYTFEPDPVNFYCLSQNVATDNVYKMQACLGESNGTTRVQQLVRPGRPHDTGGVHICGDGYLPMIAIDSLNLPDCSLIQLDVEGYEYNALLGGIKTINKYKPVLCIEFCEQWLNRYDSTSNQILSLVDSLGYELVGQYGVDKIFTPKAWKA